jgi:sarcosine oxidase subunit gamma
MSEYDLTPTPVLITAPTGRFGKSDGAAEISLIACPEKVLLQIITSPDRNSDHQAVLEALESFGSFELRNAGPGQWFALSDAAPDKLDLNALETALAGTADVVDQSSGRIRIVIEGRPVRDALSKGIPIDLHTNEFTVGETANTLCGHLSVHLTRTATDRYEIIVLRSYALSLWESLIEMGLEYGIYSKHQD